MSKKSNKPSKQQITEKQELKKKKKKIRAVITAVISLAVVACIVVSCILITQYSDRAEQLYRHKWVPVSAKNASDDEVDISEVYNVMYSNYQGNLSFSKDGTFQLWLSPGDPSDGTHTGSFEIKDDIIKADFDEGTQTEFMLERENGYIKTITIGYDEYTVVFGESSEEN